MDFSDWKIHKYDDTFNQIDVRNKVIADLCCLHGRVGARSLDRGAKYVKFIDAIDPVDELKTNFAKYDSNKWQHIKLDLSNEAEDLVKHLQDANICFYYGHLYHATNHFDILKFLSLSNIENLIIDTSWPLWLGNYNMWNDKNGMIIYNFETTDNHMHAFSNEYDNLYIGMPNKQWIKSMVINQFSWDIMSEDEMIIDFKDKQQVRYMIRLARKNNE